MREIGERRHFLFDFLLEERPAEEELDLTAIVDAFFPLPVPLPLPLPALVLWFKRRCQEMRYEVVPTKTMAHAKRT